MLPGLLETALMTEFHKSFKGLLNGFTESLARSCAILFSFPSSFTHVGCFGPPRSSFSLSTFPESITGGVSSSRCCSPKSPPALR